MIRSLWGWQAKTIIDVKLVSVDIDFYRFEAMAALLDWWEKIKKYKHGKHFYEQRKKFPQFFLSIDGMLGRETLAILEILIWLMAEKMDEPILHVQGWVNGSIVIAATRLY